ncbi:MAG TPA: epimerase [Dokdonella sp.]|uniref:NAD-dependent epimerase/dehydratase family protein n=1 Tax=Dokdonella sp. TaxID=2291710 RepID=UPI0025C16510|nr:NAD-dependent epimerase/dehydratase family protein [Dokdonella sp.]MBX3693074.1 epimerase [Dokdonella sp.]MCW5567351.1 epimerase [Dokdonella sp.]HNR92172.1 epimerase [Dokdonella sp.]
MPISRRDLIKLGALAGALGLTARPGLLRADTPAIKPLRILILGGTGFIGPHQVRYAVARGHQVTVFNRGQRQADLPGGVEHLNGDRDKGDLAALKGREWDVCIDNPTSTPFWVRDAAKVLKGKVKQYMFVSTISVYADNGTPNADEDAALAKYTGRNVMKETRDSLRANMALYGPLKAACEFEARKQFRGTATIVRPGLIVGPGDPTDRFTYWPVRLAQGGDVVAPGDGSDPVQVIDARDLTEWMIRLAESRTFGVFNATGPNYTMSMAALLHGIRATTTAGATLHWIPTTFLAEQKVSPWSDMPVWIPAQGDSAGFGQRNIGRALATGLSFRPLATTASDTLAWFKSLPAERQAKLGSGLTPEREKTLLDAWKAKAAG